MKSKKILVLFIVIMLVMSMLLVACDKKKDGDITWGEWEIVKEPTMEAAGEIKRTASDGSVESVPLPIVNETNYTKTVVSEPTCSKDGEVTYTATIKDKEYRYSFKLDMLGHDWSETTYTWTDTTSCVATRVCNNDNAHIETATATITSAVTLEPTFTAKGKTTYTATFAEEWAKGTEPITKVVENVPMYTKAAVAGVEATVNSVGNIAYWTGSNGKYYSDETCTQEITLENTVIPKLAITKVDKVDAIYGANGNKEYYYETANEANKYYLVDGTYVAIPSESDLVIDEILGTITIYVNGVKQETTISHKKSEAIDKNAILEIVDVVSGKDYIEIKTYDSSDIATRKDIADVAKYAKDNKDVTFYCVKIYNVTFDSGVKAISGEYNTIATKPADPAKTGYTFCGWYTIDDQVYVFDKFNENVDLHAKWTANKYKVTLKYNDAATADTVVDVTYDEAYPTLPDCTLTGYTFEGWFTGETDGELIAKNGTYTYAEEMTIYAHWTANTYTIGFDSLGGNVVASKDVTFNQPFAFEVPTREGFNFVGWYTINDEGYSYKLTDELGNGLNPWHIEWGVGKYEDVKVWAGWEEIIYSVTCTQEQVNGVDAGLLLVNGGVNTADVAFGKNFTIEATAKLGYEFVGWYKGDVEVTKENAYTTTMPNESPSYVAKFALKPEFADFEFTSTISSLTITKYTGSATEVAIPNGTTVIGDGTNVIVNQSVTKVVLPEGLKTISAHAFGDKASPLFIDTINIPNTVQTIGDYAFAELYSITTITLPKGLATLGAHAFDGCDTLSTVNIGELTSLTEIKPYTFYETSLNSNFTIPGNIKKIGGYAFAGIGGQDFDPTITITLEEGVQEIGDHAFNHSYSNESIELSCYSNVKALVVPKSVTQIGVEAIHPSGQLEVYYCGTESELALIVGNENLTSDAAGVFYYSKNSNTDGYHWRYDTDNKTPIKW